MADAKLFAQHGREFSEDVLRAGHICDFNVGAERREPWADGPDVDVVHRDHALDGGTCFDDRGRLKAGRGAFEEDVGGLAQQAPGAREDKEGDGDTGQRVHSGPAAQCDERRGRDDEHRAEGVRRGLEPGCAGVQVVVRVAVE